LKEKAGSARDTHGLKGACLAVNSVYFYHAVVISIQFNLDADEIIRSHNCAEARKEMDSMNTNSKDLEPMLVAKREELVDLIHALSPDDLNGQTAIDYLFEIDEEGNGSDKSQLEWRTDWYEKNLANCDPLETVYMAKRCYEDGDVDSALWFLAKGANRGDVEAMYCFAL
jgi:hypothetical protein